MTDAQSRWLDENSSYQLVGPPRPGVSFRDCGTLYEDGEFVPSKPLVAIQLRTGCRLVGVPDKER